jgi:hypothetical protein
MSHDWTHPKLMVDIADILSIINCRVAAEHDKFRPAICEDGSAGLSDGCGHGNPFVRDLFRENVGRAARARANARTTDAIALL